MDRQHLCESVHTRLESLAIKMFVSIEEQVFFDKNHLNSVVWDIRLHTVTYHVHDVETPRGIQTQKCHQFSDL